MKHAADDEAQRMDATAKGNTGKKSIWGNEAMTVTSMQWDAEHEVEKACRTAKHNLRADMYADCFWSRRPTHDRLEELSRCNDKGSSSCCFLLFQY